MRSMKLMLVGCCAVVTPLLTGCYPALSVTAELAPATEREYSAPSFTHRVIDAETKQPIKGVVVWGYFALREGATSPGGGTKGVNYIRTFEVVTDANGEYTIPAWKSGPIKSKLEPDDHAFPVIAMYKPAYRTVVYGEGSMYAIGPNRPEHVQGYGGGKASDKGPPVLDLRGDPTALIPTKTLRERFDVYGDAGAIPTPMSYPCGFNDFPNKLVIRHYELKQLVQLLVPPNQITPDGYAKGGFFHPDNHINGLNEKSALERLSAWPCPTNNSLDLLKKAKVSP